MSQSFSDYHEARQEAEDKANLYGRDMGIRRQREYGQEVYVVSILPDARNRYGHELRAEVVSPADPALLTELTLVRNL